MGNQIQLPYSVRLPEPIQIGSSVFILGRVHPNCHRFSVNLCSGAVIGADVPFHFNPRFDKGYVCCNCMNHDKWGKEEKTGFIPFSKNADFEMKITAETQAFHVIVNGNSFCYFNYRLAKEMVNFLHILGDVFISSVYYNQPHNKGAGAFGFPQSQQQLSGAGAFGFPQPQQQLSYPDTAPPPYSEKGPAAKPASPLNTIIPGGMFPGKIICVTGRTNNKAKRFSLNLMRGPNGSDADIALHFDVRLKFGDDCNTVIRNHRQFGAWGKEEREMSFFPFKPSTNFEIMILAEANCYKIAVNQKHFTSFNHRIFPLQQVCYVNITGDVKVTLVRFQ